MIEAMEQRSNCFSPMRLLTFEVLYSLKACPDRECSMSSIPLQRTKGKTCRLRCCSRPMIPKMDDASCKAAFVALLDCSRVPESHRRQPRHVHAFIQKSSSTFEGPPHRMTQTYSGMMGLFSKQDLSRSPYSIALPYHHYTDRSNSIASRGTAMAYRHYIDRNNSTRGYHIGHPVQLQTTCFFLCGGRPTHVQHRDGVQQTQIADITGRYSRRSSFSPIF